MDFEHSARSRELQERLLEFMDAHIYPNERRFHEEIEANRSAGNAWQPTKVIEELKPKARAAGLWNLFLPRSPRAPDGGLSNLDYAPLCEIMGRVHFAPEVFNCSAPDTGNMETFERYASEELKRQWLDPLLRGEIRSAFLMTEPDVRFVRRHQRPGPHRAARRQLRDQWTQMVVERRGRSALQGLHRDGQDRPRCRTPQTAIHDRRTFGRTRHHGRAASVDLRLRRCPARTHAGLAQRRCGAS